jgi:hypothetical protein
MSDEAITYRTRHWTGRFVPRSKSNEGGSQSPSHQSSPNKVLPGWEEIPVVTGVRRIFCSAKLHSICLSSSLSTRLRYLTNPCAPPALSRLPQTVTSLRGRGRSRSALPTQCRGSTAPPLFTPVHVDSLKGSLRGAVIFSAESFALALITRTALEA